MNPLGDRGRYTRVMRTLLQRQPLRRTSLRRTASAACALALAGVLVAAPGAAEDDAAPPATGTAAATTLALLSYNRELCDDIAGKLVNHWRGLSSSPEAQLEAMRRRVVDREISTLASARSASDLVDRFLPQVRQETNRKTGDALERQHDLVVELCDTIAYPNGTQESFEAELAVILDRIESEQAELGRLEVVSESALESALAPYLGHLQMAGVEAEGEFRDYIDSLKPPPQLPSLQDHMEAWHRGYAQAVLPTKQALGKYLGSRRANDATMISTSCREILAAVIPLLRNERALGAPLPAVTKPLRRAFTELKMMASHCTAGRSREMETHYREMQAQLAAASGVLAEFTLKP